MIEVRINRSQELEELLRNIAVVVAGRAGGDRDAIYEVFGIQGTLEGGDEIDYLTDASIARPRRLWSYILFEFETESEAILFKLRWA